MNTKKTNSFKVSYFENFRFAKDISLVEIIQAIQEEHWGAEIKRIREFKDNRDSDWEKLKDELPTFAISGTFYPTQDKEHLNRYNRIVGLQIDGLMALNAVEDLRKRINRDLYTLGSFVMPSGSGLQVFTRVDSNAERHQMAHLQVAHYYWQRYIDASFKIAVKNINNFSSISSDKAAQINTGASIFSVKKGCYHITRPKRKHIDTQIDIKLS